MVSREGRLLNSNCSPQKHISLFCLLEVRAKRALSSRSSQKYLQYHKKKSYEGRQARNNHQCLIILRSDNNNRKENPPYRFLLATPLASRMNILSEFSVLRILSKFGLTALRSESTQRSISSAERQLKYRVLVGEVTWENSGGQWLRQGHSHKAHWHNNIDFMLVMRCYQHKGMEWWLL